VRLRDGGLAVVDGGSRRLRFYGPGGSPAFSWPAEGEPSPFQGITSLEPMADDSLLAFDGASSTLFVLGPDGSPVRDIHLDAPEEGSLSRASSLGDGTFVVRGGWSTALLRGARPGLIRPPLSFLRFDGGGRLLDTLAVVPGDAVVLVQLGPAGAFVPPVLGPLTASGVHDGRLYLGTGETFQIRVYDREGDLERLLRVPGVDLTVTPEELREARGGWSALERGNPIAGRILAQVERSVPPPTTRPALASLLVDRQGNVWVGEYPRGGLGMGGQRRPTDFTVLDSGGRLLGRVGVPEGFEPTDIGGDWVVGIHRGPGAETVRAYRLERKEP